MYSRIYKNRGILLIAMASVATIWLGATQQLALYIHPRYNLFSIIFSLIGLIFIAFCFNLRSSNKKITRKNSWTILLLLLVSGISLLVFKPATLSSDIASQRGVNTASNTQSLDKLANSEVISPFENQNLQLNVKEWAGLISQTNDPAFFIDRKVSLEGFISAAESNQSNTFFVSRFVVSCCAVDARPVGVAVHKNSWANELALNQWVRVEGEFINQDGQIMIKPNSISQIDQPKEPYVY